MLQGVKKSQEEIKEILGEEYHDFNLVVALPNGRPVEGQVINRALKALIKEHDLPDVVFHSLRHTSTTYKLKLNKGDMKSVQGDTGHAQMKMVTDVYSHIIDEDRRTNAITFEEAFYHQDETKSAGKIQNHEQEAIPEAEQVIKMLQNSPDLAAQLLHFLSAGQQTSK